MRIIGGDLKRQRLESPPDAKTTRPMPDHVRESVFNILRGHFEGASVFDAFAGTGAVGLEAVSRGASRVVMVERDKRIAALLRRNVEHLGVEDDCEIVVGDALGAGALARCPMPVDVIFFDPPYPLVRDPAGWARVRRQFEAAIGRLTDTGFAVIRTPWPFLHLVREDGTSAMTHEEEAPARGRRGGRGRSDRGGRDDAERAGKRGGRRRREDEAEEVVSITLDADGEIDEAALDAFERALAEDAARAGEEAQAVRRVDPEMTFETAEGPETHVYGSTAVHLYMRRKAGP